MSFDAMGEDQLLDYLHEEATRRGYEFRIRLVEDDRWRAALYMSYDPLGMSIERIRWSGDGPNRLTALKELACVLNGATDSDA